MTIKEVIDAVDTLKPNQYSIREKVQWLSFVDERIINDVLKTHEGYDEAYDKFNGYSEDDLTVSLIVESPYDRIYPAFITMKIDECNGDINKYNNSYALYNTYLIEYRRYYNKTHMPLPVGVKKVSCPVKPIYKLSEAEIAAIKRDLYFQLSQEGVGDLVTFGDLTPEQIELLRGEKGESGKDGVDGKDGVTPDMSNYVAKTDTPAYLKPSLMLVKSAGSGLSINEGYVTTTPVLEGHINNRNTKEDLYRVLNPAILDYAVRASVTTNKYTLTDTEKASALLWLGAVKGRLVTGSYVGAGASPKVITFDGKPLLVFVACTNAGLGVANAAVMINGQSCAITYKKIASNDIGSADLKWEDNTLTISNTASSSAREHCLNATQKNYDWYAILEG